MEAGAEEYFRRIDELGGVVAALRSGYFQREIAEAAYRYQREIDERERRIVGVNAYEHGNEVPLDVELHRVTEESEHLHLARLRRVRAERDNVAVGAALAALGEAARGGRDNLMPCLVEAVRRYATLGEVCGVLRQVYGEYQEPVLV